MEKTKLQPILNLFLVFNFSCHQRRLPSVAKGDSPEGGIRGIGARGHNGHGTNGHGT